MDTCEGSDIFLTSLSDRIYKLEACHSYTANVKAQTEAGFGEGSIINIYTSAQGQLLSTHVLQSINSLLPAIEIRSDKSIKSFNVRSW